MADLENQRSAFPTRKVTTAGAGVAAGLALWLAAKFGFPLAPDDAEIIIAAVGVVLAYFVRDRPGVTKLGVLFLAIAFSLGMVACGDGGDDSGAQEVAEAAGILDGISQDGTGNSQNVDQCDASQNGDVTVTGDGNNVTLVSTCEDASGQDNSTEETTTTEAPSKEA